MVAITHQTLMDEIRRQQQLARSISDDQAAVSGGKSLTQPSQDPQAWVQVSEIAKAQAQQAAWTANITYAQSRAAKADSNLEQMSNLLARARELMITASTSALDAAGKTAVVTELDGIRASVSELLNEKDYQGLPIFDDGTSIRVPVARGMQLDAVGTRQSISDGIDVGGTPMSLDAILAASVAAIQSGDGTATEDALTGLKAGIDHVVNEQALQGVRGNRLEAASDRLSDVDLSLQERRSKIEDTDLTQTLAGLQAKLLSLEAAQAAFARINQKSLFDLLS